MISRICRRVEVGTFSTSTLRQILYIRLLFDVCKLSHDTEHACSVISYIPIPNLLLIAEIRLTFSKSRVIFNHLLKKSPRFLEILKRKALLHNRPHVKLEIACK